MKKTKAWSVKIRLALLALAALVWIAVPVTAKAETNVWDGTIADKFAGGDGSEENPYQITTGAELAYLAQQVNSGTDYNQKCFVLEKDLDLGIKDWTPIGTKEKSFWGGFDGGGHTITGMNVSGDQYVGLFGNCYNFTAVSSYIKNVTVKDSSISGSSYVGAIAGLGANIYDCYSINNKIESTTNTVGGVCGYLRGDISGCYNSSSVHGRNVAGGIVGSGLYNGKNGNGKGEIKNCYNAGTVNASNIDSYAGGIVGGSMGNYNISDCVNCGQVTGSGQTDSIVAGTNSTMTFTGNCYYKNDENSASMGEGTNDKVIPLTTIQLCGALPDGLDATIWASGSIDTANGVAEKTGSRFGTAPGTYINLQSVATAGITNTASVPVYDFGTTNGNDWDIYTLITTAEEFAAIGQNRDKAKWSANYVLGKDINVSGVELIAIGDPEIPYTGKFSGDGHTIRHVDMTEDRGVESGGLFGQIGYIQNPISTSGKVMLLAANGDIVSSQDAGGICGNLFAGEIYGCSFTGTVKGNRTGGISGGISSGMISQCFFAGDVQGRNSAAGICGMGGVVGGINHCISIATIDTTEDDYYLAGIANSRDYGVTNCYFNNDVCKAVDTYNLGRSTLKLTSPDFFDDLITNQGFNGDIWTKKPNDKENGIAYYPSLGEANAVPVNYQTSLAFAATDVGTPTYGQSITFHAEPWIAFTIDGQPITEKDTNGSFEIRIGNETVVNAKDFQEDGTATYKAQTAGETTFTLVYTGNEKSYFSEMTKDLTVDIAPAELTAEGAGIASGTYGDKLSELTVTGLTAKLGSETIDGTWRIDGDKVPCVGDNETYTAMFIPKEHPEYYLTLTAQVTLEISKAIAPKIQDLDLKYSWAAKGEKAVQIPGLPSDMGETTMTVITQADSKNVLAADPGIKYSEGKLLFTLGENTIDDIGQYATVMVRLQSINYREIDFCLKITRIEKADREDTPAPDAFDMTFTVSGNDLAAQITTDRTDVEYSFDGTTWGLTKAARVGHNEKVTVQIRYAENDDYNASAPVSKTWNSGHGTLTHHERVEPTCQAEGSIEYWTCDVCGLYFATADGSESITAAEIGLPKMEHTWSEDYQSDLTGHWHKCSVCGAATNTESHISSGAATTEQAEICTVCGYEIAPKKPADNNINNGSNNNGSSTNGGNSNTVSGNNAGGNTDSSGSDSDDDDDSSDNSSQASGTEQKTADGVTSSPSATAKPGNTVKPSKPTPVKPSATPAADENHKEDTAQPSGEAQETPEERQEERTDSMTAQTSGSQESDAEQMTETSGRGTSAGRVAAAAAAGTAVVGGGGAAIYVTIKKGKFKFK